MLPWPASSVLNSRWWQYIVNKTIKSIIGYNDRRAPVLGVLWTLLITLSKDRSKTGANEYRRVNEIVFFLRNISPFFDRKVKWRVKDKEVTRLKIFAFLVIYRLRVLLRCGSTNIFSCYRFADWMAPFWIEWRDESHSIHPFTFVLSRRHVYAQSACCW